MAEGRGGVVKLSFTTDLTFENRAVFESIDLVLNSIRIELQEIGIA